MNSLDPRIKRINADVYPALTPKKALDQFATFEVFVQPSDKKPFQHEGIVHAPDIEMAYVLAKETFTRRFTCISLYVVATGNVKASAMTDGNINAYDMIKPVAKSAGPEVSYQVYHLAKRGKQHIHAGTVTAGDNESALAAAKAKYSGEKIVYNIWVIRTHDIRFTSPDDLDLWTTLPEKKFRDASEYKGGDKLKKFLATHQQKTSQ